MLIKNKDHYLTGACRLQGRYEKKTESDREFINMCENHNDNVFHVLGEVKRCKKNLKRRDVSRLTNDNLM